MPERKAARRTHATPQSESEHSDIEIEISDDSPGPTQVSSDAQQQSVGWVCMVGILLDHHMATESRQSCCRMT